MNRRAIISTLAVIGMAIVAIGVSARHVKASQGEVKEIEVSAKKYEFTPGEIHVKKGEHVRLKITATDREHGFEVAVFPQGSDKKGEPGLKFSSEKPNFKLPANNAQTIEFDALLPGTYDFKCSVFCGMGHGGMKGTIIVEP
jgi:cytochrome c oxidase subunit 2